MSPEAFVVDLIPLKPRCGMTAHRLVVVKPTSLASLFSPSLSLSAYSLSICDDLAPSPYAALHSRVQPIVRRLVLQPRGCLFAERGARGLLLALRRQPDRRLRRLRHVQVRVGKNVAQFRLDCVDDVVFFTAQDDEMRLCFLYSGLKLPRTGRLYNIHRCLMLRNCV